MIVEADVAVVGGGPAGIAAAACAAESGQRVVVVDESASLGGQIWRQGPGHRAPSGARRWLARFGRSGASTLASASVIDAQRDAQGGFVLCIEGRRTTSTVHVKRVVLTTGARERFIPFPGWTLPGVVGIGGAQALLKSGMSAAGRAVVIAGSGPLLLPVAASLRAAGARVTLVAEQAPRRDVLDFVGALRRRPAALLDAVRYRARFLGTPYRFGWWITEARGDTALRDVVLTDGRRTSVVGCDMLCTGYGLVPNNELARLLGCTVEDGAVVVDDEQRTSVDGVYCAGEPTGIGGVDLALVEGEVAGLCVAGRAREARARFARRARLRSVAAAMERAFAPRAELRAAVTAETIVCRCEDVRFGAVDPAWSPRQAKLYTRVGMGPCQGRVCGAALSFLHGWPADAVRAPIAPARLESLARPREAPERASGV